jgi:hypothetical protein
MAAHGRVRQDDNPAARDEIALHAAVLDRARLIRRHREIAVGGSCKFFGVIYLF